MKKNTWTLWASCETHFFFDPCQRKGIVKFQINKRQMNKGEEGWGKKRQGIAGVASVSGESGVLPACVVEKGEKGEHKVT